MATCTGDSQGDEVKNMHNIDILILLILKILKNDFIVCCSRSSVKVVNVMRTDVVTRGLQSTVL